MFGLGLQELIVIFLIIFLLFGAKALPEIAKSLGQAMRIFKKEAHDLSKGIEGDQKASTTEEKKPGNTNDFDPSVEKRDWRADLKKEDKDEA